ncbi:MAG TPA: hypothetical protein VLN45_10370 [Ignavibacteriaceae bacterium]|nr:hypothetical protein [Ignavibacteriaceae bacterium]
MKKDSMKIFFALVFFFFLNNSIFGQSLNELEKKFERLNTQLIKENKTLDSLKIIHSKKAEQIDSEKKKKNPDKENITTLMAGTVFISNKIEEQNKKVSYIEKDFENLKKQLHTLYSVKIDSLQKLKDSGNENEEDLDKEILLLTEKNLLVAPKIPKLSFSPEKILKIDLNKAKDQKEKTIYKEYLNSALTEVNLLLGSVEVQISEVEQVVNLHTKTKKFLEEAELEGNMIVQNQENQSANFNAFPRFTDEGISNDFALNLKTYQLILSQLDIQQLSKPDLNLKISFDVADKNINAMEYEKLLKEVKQRLQEFKLVLANKIGSAK